MKLELESIRRLQTPAIQTTQFFSDTKRYVFITVVTYLSIKITIP